MSKTNDTLTLNNNPLPVNYEAQKWLNWFVSDGQNMQNLCSQIFRGNQISTDQSFIDLITAANVSVAEIESDVAKIKEFLAAYIPPNNN